MGGGGPLSGAELPLVSALVPVYNYGRYLGRTLDSALAQDYPPEKLEIVVVDDGSTDDTPDVLAGYEARYPGRIRSVRQENAGFIAATNATFTHARGELLAFLDSDDLWPVQKTREQVSIFRKHPEVGLVYSDAELIDPYDAVTEPSVWTFYMETPVRGDQALAPLISRRSGNPALNSTIMVRAALLERFAPIPDGVPYVDWWVAARVAQVAALEVNASRVGYRRHGENITLGATGQRAVREVLKAVQMRRQLLIRGGADGLTTRELVTAWRTFEEGAAHTAGLANSVFLPLIPASEDERAAARRHAAAAEEATRGGEYDRALRERLLAVANDPWDADSREWIADLAPSVFAEHELPDPLADARGRIVLSFLSELEKEPHLLGAYAEAIGPEDDVSLVVEAIGVSEQEALNRAQALIGALAADPATLPDVLLVTEEPEKLVRLELERRADALLSRRPPRLGIPAFPPHRMDELRGQVLGAGVAGA
jgi:hypothetical protein